MRTIPHAVLGAALIVLIAAPAAQAAAPATRGFLPPGSGVRGHLIVSIVDDYNVWAFGTGVGGPILDGRCEQSPIDPKIWYLPVSVGGDASVVCDVPQGVYLIETPGGTECSNIEGEPWYGADDADLLDCVNETLDYLTYLTITLDGRTETKANLGGYIVTGDTVNLPADNLISADAGISRFKSYFMVVAPLSRGTHVMRAYDEFFDGDFVGAVTYTINVH